MSFEFSEDYPDPLMEGNDFRRLISTVNPEIVFPESTDAYQTELEEVLAWVTANHPYNRPIPYVKAFLSRILIPGGISSSIVDIWGVEEIQSLQDEVAPICNVEKRDGLIQFGSWTGDYSDGDAWCIDLKTDQIICVPVGSGDEDPDVTRSAAYGILPNFSYFVSYLASSVIQRGWITDYTLC